MGRGSVRFRRVIAAAGSAPPPPPPDPDPSDYDAVILAAGPVLYLPLDGTAAGYNDQTGNGHNAAASGTPAADAGGPGDGKGSVRFDSSGTDYLIVADHNDLSISTTGVFTVEAWISPSALDYSHTEGTGPYVQVLGKNRYDDRSEWELRMYNSTTTNSRPQRVSGYAFNPEGGLGSGSYFQDSIAVDEWVHVTVVFNTQATSGSYPTGYVAIYKNGTLRDTDALQNFNITPANTTAPFNIGAASLDSFFEGRIARVAIYDYELSPTAIRAHYRLLVPATPGSISLARHVGATAAAGSASTIQLTVPASGVPAGSTLVCKAAHAYTATAPTMSDSRGNTYTRDATSPSDGNVTRASLFSCPVSTPLVAGDVIQVVLPSSAANRVLTIDEFEDVALTAAVQDADSDSDTSTGPTSGTAPEVTTAVADALVVGVMAVSGPTSDTYTEDTAAEFASLTRAGVTSLTLNSAWKSVNAAGTYKYVPVLGTSRLWVHLVAIYKAGPGSPTPATYDSELLAAGPVMYLTLDGTSDGLVDQTGNGHDATATGAPAAGTGIGDGKGSVDFDSSGTEYLTIPDHADLSVTKTGVLAVECWFSPAVLDFANEEDPDTAPYVYFAGKVASSQAEWQCRMYSQDTADIDPPRPQRVSVYVHNLSGGLGAGSYFQQPVAVDEWVHFVGIINTVNTSGTYPEGYTRIYRNGVLMNTDSIAPWNITPGNGTAPVHIGASALNSFFEGRVAKFAIWDREPSGPEILGRFNRADPPAPPAPTGTAEFQQHLGSDTDTASGTQSVVTLATGVPMGHTLIVHAVGDYTSAAPTIADSRGNTYTADRSAADGGTTIRATTFSGPVTEPLSAGDTITVTWPSSITRRAVTVDAWTKVAYPTVVDVTNGGTTSGTTPSVNAGTTYGDTLVVAAVFTNGPTGDTYTEDTAGLWSGLTRAGTTGGGAGADRTINAAYRAVAASGTYTYAPVLGTSRTYITQVVAYRAGTFVPPNPDVPGSADLVKHLDADHSSATGTTLVLTLPAGTDAGRPATRADVPAGLKISAGSLVAPTLPIAGMTGSDTTRNIVAPGVYEGYDFPGAVNILSDGVTLRNCRWLDSADFWAVESEARVGTIIEDCLIDGAPKGIGGVCYTARRIEFVNMKDDPFQVWSNGGSGSPTVIEDCTAYDFKPGPGKHVDGVQQVVGGHDNLYIRRCWFELRLASGYVLPDPDSGFTSPIFCQPTPQAGSGVGITLVEDNVLDTGDFYALRFEDGSTNRPIALRNRLRANTGAALIDGGVIFEGDGNVDWDLVPYHHPSEIPPGSGIPTAGGSGTVVPVGHTVIVQVVADYTSSAPTVSDAKGNVYTRDRTGVDGANTIRVAVFSGPISTALAGGDTITITWPVSIARRAGMADEYTGVLVPTVVDRQNGRTGTSASPSVAVTTANADDLLIAAVGTAGPSTDSFTDDVLWSGLTARGTSGAGTASQDRTLHAAWRSVSETGTYTYAPTLGVARLWVAAFVAYTAAVPPAPPVEEIVVYPAVSGLVPVGTLSTSGLSSTTLTEDTSTTLPVPERGFFTYSETHYLSDNSGHVPLVQSDLVTARTTLGRTLTFRYFVLEKYRTLDTIDSTYLGLLAADLATARAAGIKLIPRFAYTTSCPGEPGPYNSDATPARVVAHIGQIAPVLNQYADVIYAVQAGFIGCWGEWYYTDNFADDGSQPWILTSQNWADRQAVLNALLNGLDDRIFVLLRYSGLKDHWYPHPSTHVDAKRIGFHNDAFLAAFDDFGTYTSFSDMSASDTRAYTSFEVMARPVPNGGESAATNGVDSEWTAALAELIARGFTFLNPLYHPDVLASWGSNIDIARRRLGYRLVGLVARAQASVARGSTLNVQIDIRNDGFAYPISPRPVVVILDDQAGNRAEFKTTVDVRTFTPNGVSQTLYANILVPTALPAGSYRLCVWFPDQDPDLSIRPEYSLRMANTTIWDSTRGYHNLRSVTVT